MTDEFRGDGEADGGVGGGASATFAVGDCSVAANKDGDRRTAFVAAEGLADVSGIADLPEDDNTDDFNDDDGLNCYLAEVTGVRDGFMNARSPRSGNGTIQTGSHFGVDRGDPELSDYCFYLDSEDIAAESNGRGCHRAGRGDRGRCDRDHVPVKLENATTEPTSASPLSITLTASAGVVDDDERDEKNDSIALTGTTPSSTEQGVYVKPASIMIRDDDPDVTLSLSQDEVNEHAGTVTVPITVTTDEQLGDILNFSLTLGGTASRGDPGSTTATDDYRAPANVALQFNARQTTTTATATVTLAIVDDGTDEANKTIIFDDADGAQVGGAGKTYTVGPATLTLVDNDDT